MFQGASGAESRCQGPHGGASRHRDALAVIGEGRLVVTAHPHRCLLLYPQPAWEPIRDQILAAPSLQGNPPWCGACWWALPKM
jgi:MraZ protein